MVTVVNVHKRNGSKGEFFALELLGNVEMIQSQETGRFYATARRCSVPSSFDENTALMMIGSKMPGTIDRVQADAYDYTIPETGDVIKLAHTYEYRPESVHAAPIRALPSVSQAIRAMVHS